MRIPSFAAFTVVLLALLPTCADPCKDDGLGQEHCPDADDADGSGASSASDDGAEGGSGASGSHTGEGAGGGGGSGATGSTGDGATGATGETGTGTASGPCANGVQDGDETDVDCGGRCGASCKDGEQCQADGDCEYGTCAEGGICGDPVCEVEAEENSCQGCLKNNCCDAVVACLQDTFCACWFECISHNNDFDPCREECNGTMNPGTITSCANSRCNYVGACG